MSNTSPANILPNTAYTIEDTSSGYLLTITTYNLSEKYGVVGSSEKEHFDSVKDLLSTLNMILDTSPRHADKRTYVIEAPGDKNDNFTDEHSKVIFGY